MKYGLVIFPSKEIQNFANNYRKRYDPYYALIPPHVTLKAGFEAADQASVDKISTYLEQTVSGITPFTIEYNRFSSFHPTNNVIYLSIKDPEPLHLLHERINTEFLTDQEPYSFIPHITIGQKMTDDELHDVLSSLKMKRFKYQDKVDRLHLVYQDTDHVWKEHQTFLFEG
jgi:2'-5' RNA ligase